MKKDKQQSSVVNIGSSSLLVIFLVLCLTTFAILSLSSARNDYSFSEKLAARKLEYYEASSKAWLVTDEVDRILAETAESEASNPARNFSSSPYAKKVMAAFDGMMIQDIPLSCVSQDSDLTIRFQVPLGERQALSVILQVADYTRCASYYEIRTWQIISTEDWEDDQTLDLMPIDIVDIFEGR